MIFNFKGGKVFYMVKQHIITLNITWHVTLSHKGMVGKHLLPNQEKKAFLGVTCVNHPSKLLGGIMGQAFPLKNLKNGPTIPWPWFFLFFSFQFFDIKNLANFSKNRKKIKLYHKIEFFQKNIPIFFVRKMIGVVPKNIGLKPWPNQPFFHQRKVDPSCLRKAIIFFLLPWMITI
jgi:hypothetical protein